MKNGVAFIHADAKGVSSLEVSIDSISEYWVIDLVNKKLIVHTQPESDRYTQIKPYQTGIINPLSFPDIDIALDKLLLF